VVVTVAELAAYLGITPSAVRHIVRRHRIQPRGQRWKAKLYDPHDVLRHTGRHDRLAT
jgi:DNA-binding transcriptional MerR regulator